VILRPFLLEPRWLESERLQALPAHLQLFFLRLGHACDGAGRFENDAAILRPALYPRMLHKVSVRDVQGNVVQLHGAGLIKLYTVGARGFGEVLNYRQRDANRKVIHPAEPGEPELFTIPAAAPPGGEMNGREDEGNAREARAPQMKKTRPTRPARLFPREIEALLTDRRRQLAAIRNPGGCAYRGRDTYSAQEVKREGELMLEVAALEEALRQAVRDSLEVPA